MTGVEGGTTSNNLDQSSPQSELRSGRLRRRALRATAPGVLLRPLLNCGVVRAQLIRRVYEVDLDRIRELRPLGSGRYQLLLIDGTELVVSRGYSALFRDLVL